MKKTVRIIALFLLCALLTGCASAESVSVLIADIGPVTLDSGDAIAAAEAQYEKVIFFDKKKVENYDDLVNARQLYDAIVSKNDHLNQLADQLGEITLDSKDTISQLREEYYSATFQYGEEIFADFSVRWKQIETQYAYCELDAKMAEAERLFEEQKYLDAWNLALEIYNDPNGWKLLTKSSTLATKCSVLYNEQIIAGAQQLLDAGNPLGALSALEMLTYDHSGDAAYRRVYDSDRKHTHKTQSANYANGIENPPFSKTFDWENRSFCHTRFVLS